MQGFTQIKITMKEYGSALEQIGYTCISTIMPTIT